MDSNKAISDTSQVQTEHSSPLQYDEIERQRTHVTLEGRLLRIGEIIPECQGVFLPVFAQSHNEVFVGPPLAPSTSSGGRRLGRLLHSAVWLDNGCNRGYDRRWHGVDSTVRNPFRGFEALPLEHRGSGHEMRTRKIL